MRWEVRAGAGPHRRLLASSPHNSPLFCPSFPPSLTRTYLFRFRYWMTARSRTALVLTPQYPGTRALLHRAQVAKECPLIPGRSHTITPSQFNCAVYKRRRHAPLQKFHFIKSWFRFVFLGNHEKLVIVFFFVLLHYHHHHHRPYSHSSFIAQSINHPVLKVVVKSAHCRSCTLI